MDKFFVFEIWHNSSVSRKGKVDEEIPADFKEKYPSTRVTIDCTEGQCQMLKSLRVNVELFSSYRDHTPLNGLIGISPGGAITFISQLYTGHISDWESGFLKMQFSRGDSVMADKDEYTTIFTKYRTIDCRGGCSNPDNCLSSYSCGKGNQQD